MGLLLILYYQYHIDDNKTMETHKRRGGNRVIDAYKYILSSFAYSDAKHDFSNVSGYRGDFYSDYKHTIQTGIPISNHTEYTVKNRTL